MYNGSSGGSSGATFFGDQIRTGSGGGGFGSHLSYAEKGPPEIMPNEIEKIYVLGDGSFGTVYRGRCRAKEVAVKVLHKQDLDPSTLEAFRKEVEIVSKIFHPNVVLFMGACSVPGHMTIVTEYMPKGDLESLLSDERVKLSLAKRMEMARDAALGMNWLHCSKPPIIHRDLKASNLLVDENYSVKLCDFGLSQVKNSEVLLDGSEGAKGTPLWMAPEVLLCKPFDEKADVYSFGLVLWQMLTCVEPFSEYKSFKVFRDAICTKHIRPQIPANTNPILRTLIEACWHPNKDRRPNFNVIITELEKCIIESAIKDPNGRNMWFSKFSKYSSVKWTDFLSGFIDFLDEAFISVNPQKPLPKGCPEFFLKRATKEQLEEYQSRSEACFHSALNELKRRRNPDISLAQKIEDCYFIEDKVIVNCLERLLVENSSKSNGVETRGEMVSIGQFGNLCEWFGPFDLCAPKDPSGKFTITLLDNILSTLSKEWFFGFLTTDEAHTSLSSRDVGSFLVRFSSTTPGNFSISQVSRDAKSQKILIHRRVARTPDGMYQTGDDKFPSLKKLIENAAFNLFKPCPGSKLHTDLFGKKGISITPDYVETEM